MTAVDYAVTLLERLLWQLHQQSALKSVSDLWKRFDVVAIGLGQHSQRDQ